MRLLRGLVVAALMALGCAACTAATEPRAEPSLVAVPTQEPQPAGTPRACPASLIEGTLVADERWGLALEDAGGTVREVLWPFGYAARDDGGALVLIDAAGSVVAHEGERVQIGGGETGSNNAWLGCGGISVLTGG